MSSTKIVKVTNSKILNYEVTAPGYKPVLGSKQILEDTNVNINMIPSEASRDVYTIGDRIGGVATFFTYYTDAAGQKYAVFIADAKYRIGNCVWGTKGALVDVPYYTSNPSAEVASTLSGTYVTQHIFDNYYYTAMTTDPYPAFKAVRDAVSIPSLGNAGMAVVPNCFEVNTIYQLRELLDSYDPTVQTYSFNSLTNWNMGGNSSSYVWCCYINDTAHAWRLNANGRWSTSGGRDDYGDRDEYRYGFLPVFEVPVNN